MDTPNQPPSAAPTDDRPPLVSPLPPLNSDGSDPLLAYPPVNGNGTDPMSPDGSPWTPEPPPIGQPARLSHSQRLTARAALTSRWIIPNMIPYGMATLIGGPKGGGKTYLLAHLAALSIAGALEAFDEQPTPVVFLGGDSGSTDEISERLLAMGVTTHMLDQMLLIPDWASPNLSTHAAKLTRWAVERGAKLVIADPLAAFHGGDSHVEAEVRRGLEPWFTASEAAGLTTVGIHHLRKGEGSFLDALSGSGAYVGVVRSVLAFAPPIGLRDQGRRSLVLAKSNCSPLDPNVAPSEEYVFQKTTIRLGEKEFPQQRLTLMGAGTTREYELDLTNHVDSEQATAMEIAAVALTGASTKETGVPATNLYKEGTTHGFTKIQMRNAIRRLGGKWGRDGFQGHVVWWIPKTPELVAAYQARAELDPPTPPPIPAPPRLLEPPTSPAAATHGNDA